jgi:hypothetical protein
VRVRDYGVTAPMLSQACATARYSVMLFCPLRASLSASGLMLSSPRKTRLTPARPHFPMNPLILWGTVST